MLGPMYTARQFALLALLTAALTSFAATRAAAQETEYDPEGRQLAPSAVPDGYVDAGVSPPADAPPTSAPPADTSPSGAPPPSAIPAPPSDELAAPPGAYRLQGDPTPHYPRAAPADVDGADATTDQGVRIPPRVLARLRALDRDYTALSVRGSSGIVDGILSIVTGGLSIAIGAVLPDAANGYATYLYVFGAGNVAHGIVNLFISPDPVDPALIFAHMPMGSVSEVKARLRFGEQSLEGLADSARLGRILEGSLDIATGVAFVPFYLAPRDYKLDGGILDIVVLTAALIRVISGVATLVVRSEIERRWSAYEALRAELRLQRESRRAVHAELGASPLPGGGAVTLSGSF